MTESTEQLRNKYIMEWQPVANILSKGFLAVHHGKVVPIDVIEQVQALFYKALESRQSVLQSQLRKEIEGLLKRDVQFGFQGILMGINSAASNQTYNSAIKDVLNLLQETK